MDLYISNCQDDVSECKVQHFKVCALCGSNGCVLVHHQAEMLMIQPLENAPYGEAQFVLAAALAAPACQPCLLAIG